MTKILIIDNGIEFDSIIASEKAIGGAETAFVSLVEALARSNFDVSVYNNCRNTGEINGVIWKKLSSSIHEESFDILIINRGDKFLNFRKEVKKRIFWIHNPANYLLKWRYLSKLFLNPTTIVFSSQYHKSTYPVWCPSKDKVVIPYGVDSFILNSRTQKLAPKPIAIFTSNPLRGLNWLLDRWENEIFPFVPNAEFHLYTGSKTYGSFGKKHTAKMKPIIDRAKKLSSKGVQLFEPIERKKLIKKILNKRLFLYQGSNDETFCMSVAEAQTLGVPTVVCDLGCMSERVRDNETGFVCKNETEFSQSTIKILQDKLYWNKMHKNMIKDKKSYKSWNDIVKLWKKILV